MDRTPIDCWLYQKQFLERLAADYGPREQFLDEFNIDIFVGFTPWPNQTGRLLDTSELPEFYPGDPRDPRWLTHTSWDYDFAGLNVVQALEQQGDRAGSSPICGASSRAPAASSASRTAGPVWSSFPRS